MGPHGAPSSCIPEELLETSTTSTHCSSNKKKTQKVQRIWQELTRDENIMVKAISVIDFGLIKSARTKPRMNSEVVKSGSNKINITPVKVQDEKKKTSRTKVKTASSKKRQPLGKNTPQSPSLKRLQTPRLDKIAARTNLLSPKPEKSQNNFKKLL